MIFGQKFTISVPEFKISVIKVRIFVTELKIFVSNIRNFVQEFVGNFSNPCATFSLNLLFFYTNWLEGSNYEKLDEKHFVLCFEYISNKFLYENDLYSAINHLKKFLSRKY